MERPALIDFHLFLLLRFLFYLYLINRLAHSFPSSPILTVFDSFEMSIPVGSENFDMVLWDTAGEEDHDRLRPLS